MTITSKPELETGYIRIFLEDNFWLMIVSIVISWVAHQIAQETFGIKQFTDAPEIANKFALNESN